VRVPAPRTQASFRKNQKVYARGDPADSVFYVQEEKLKVVVLWEQGKEAVPLYRVILSVNVAQRPARFLELPRPEALGCPC
jgi:hypothetical protein